MAIFQQDQEVARWFIFSVSQAAGPVSAKLPSSQIWNKKKLKRQDVD